ncbi:hypothetical protein RhiirA4_428827 [Rhizophagus irregularis]|uniref:Uncharacterized protein n=1 Tax=Rhizophagus irregularis TaxID=588596 RepID=A0A2I1HEI9_9GLOM|nr:hypothetical protein RhiirA4_428827 [Rhizophagus irregularis]
MDSPFTNLIHDRNVIHETFIPRDSFPKDMSNEQILNLIKTALVNEPALVNAYIKRLTYQLIVIQFDNLEKKQHYINNIHDVIKKPIYDYTNENVKTLLKSKFSDIDNTCIKVLDIPYHYDSALIVTHLANITKATIKNYKEIIHNRRPLRTNHANPAPSTSSPDRTQDQSTSLNQNIPINRRRQRSTTKPQYKQLLVRFEKESTVKYIYEELYWNLAIENFIVRIVPGNPNHEEYKKRTTNYYKITGIQLNTNARDLEPLIKLIKGRTCTFTSTTRSSICKSAYVYTDNESYTQQPDKVIQTTMYEHKLYIYANKHQGPQPCTRCGSPDHQYKEYNAPHTLDANKKFKIYKKIFLKKQRTVLATDKDVIDNYNHVIQLNKHDNNKNANRQRLNNIPPNTNTPSPKYGAKQQRNSTQQHNAPPSVRSQRRNNTFSPPVTHSDYIELREKFTKLEALYKFLENKYSTLEKTLQNHHTRQENADIKVFELGNKITPIENNINEMKEIKKLPTTN